MTDLPREWEPLVDRVARAICDLGIRKLNGHIAAWPRDEDGLRHMARIVLLAVSGELVPRAELRERVMHFGGFQRAETGEFWVSRDDVLRLLDEVSVPASVHRGELTDGSDVLPRVCFEDLAREGGLVDD